MSRPWPRAVLLAFALALALSIWVPAPHAAEESPTDEEISKRMLDLEAREQALRLLERDLDAKLEQLKQLRQLVAQTIEPAEARRQADIKKLVSFYGAMKPQSAATLLEKLPRPLSADVLSAMKARDAGKILNVMRSDRAVQISKLMAGQE